MDQTNVIELNGKRYDAVTGKYLGKSHAKPVPATKGAGGKIMDGVVRPSARPGHQQHNTHSAPKPRTTRKHHTPNHIDRRQTQHTKTLMRHAVPKPKPVPKKLPSTKGLDRAPAHSLAIKESASKIDPHRQQRANSARQHQHVKRFQPPTTRTVPQVHARNSRPAPIQEPRPQTSPAARSTAPSQQNYNAIFEAAVAHANSHQQQSPRIAKKRSRHARLIHATLAIVVVLTLGGFVAWTQRAQIELQIASWQAGFDARMPSYALTGYERGDISQEHGNITMSYSSGDRHYNITQQASSWNSQTLLDQNVAGTSTEEVQTVESKGRIIYVHGNNASWVDGGVRYDINGNAPLNTKDILAIVDSM